MVAKTLGGLVLAALLGGAVGGLVVGVLGSALPGVGGGGPAAAEDAAEDAIRAAERVVELETRVRELERRRPRAHAGAESAADPPRGGDTAARAAGDTEHGAAGATPAGGTQPGAMHGEAQGEAPRAVDRSFVDDVEAALRVITERRTARDAEAKRLAQQEKYLGDLDRRLADYQERLGLTDGQLEEVSRLAHAGVAKYVDAQANGATPAELGGIGRSLSRSVRDLLGGDTYRHLRLLDLDRAARPRIADVSSRAGVDAGQRQRIEQLLTRHLEGIVDDEVRLRTEEMADEDRARLRESLDTANRAAWDRIRSDILTEEQRGRVPIRLR